MAMDTDTRVGEIIQACRSILPDDALKEVDHLFEHGEPAMAFEGLVIELMQADVVPPPYDFDEWCALARDCGLDDDPVFDGAFWMKFVTWGHPNAR
jgi:hypothetical protein